MDCREFAEFVSDFLAGELAPDRDAAFRHHLTLCPECVRYLDSLERTIQLAKWAESPEAPLPPEIPQRLLDAIRASRN